MSLDGVYLAWNNSSSIDVENSVLIRENAKTYEVDTLFSWSDTLSFFQDHSGVPGTIIRFIRSLHQMRKPNYVTSDPLAVIYETGTRLPVQNVQAEVDREEKQIKLTWETG